MPLCIFSDVRDARPLSSASSASRFSRLLHKHPKDVRNATADAVDRARSMPFVCISKAPTGLDAWKPPPKATRAPAGTSAPGTSRTPKRPPGHQKCVSGRLRYPLDAAVAADGRAGGLGGDRARARRAPSPAAPGPTKPGRNASWMLFRWDEEPGARIAAYHGTRRTHGAPHEPYLAGRAAGPAVVAVQSSPVETY